jgi:hypothetical protein
MRSLKTMTWSIPLLMGILIVALSAGWPSDAPAGVVLTSPELPPESDPHDCASIISIYAGEGVHVIFPGPIDLSDPIHKCFQNVVRQDVAGDEVEDFDSVFDGLVDVGGGPVPITLTGPVSTVVRGKTGHTTGTFETEIISMSLTGNIGPTVIQIQESPTLQSQGSTTITDLGGGLWQIDSFFDVYTEVSVDGGPWQPQTSPAARMDLVPTGPTAVEPTVWGSIKTMFR